MSLTFTSHTNLYLLGASSEINIVGGRLLYTERQRMLDYFHCVRRQSSACIGSDVLQSVSATLLFCIVV